MEPRFFVEFGYEKSLAEIAIFGNQPTSVPLSEFVVCKMSVSYYIFCGFV